MAGPSDILAIVLLIAFRVGFAERRMLEALGKDYEAHTARTKRLVPGVW